MPPDVCHPVVSVTVQMDTVATDFTVVETWPESSEMIGEEHDVW